MRRDTKINTNDIVIIKTIEQALNDNYRENIKSPFWKDFAGKSVIIKVSTSDYYICTDGEKTYQVFGCDIHQVVAA